VSLFDTATETVMVFPQEPYTDSSGDTRYRPSQTGVEITRCIVQPMSALKVFPSLDPTQQQRVYATWRLMARDAPLGVWARVEWRGKRFSVRSGPEYRPYSSATSHVTAVLQEER
jgi:hypothetical protein